MNPKNVLVISFKPQCKVSNLKWVTREYVHVDRTACPWLIKKFIDPEAEFIFVPTEKIEEVTKTQGAIPFDAPGVKLGHHDGRCSFETIIEEYKLKDPVLHELAKIVHSADTRDTELAPEGIGLSAIMTGARLSPSPLQFQEYSSVYQQVPYQTF
ncbi:chromate resistance protein [Candidatus Bathyarchaeota archaeon]|nr:MAG: chromate resistance protein [Candidatus Bathyarchaeota archaeon]